MDHAFRIADGVDVSMVPCLVMYDNQQENIWAIPVDHKGVGESVAEGVMDRLAEAGHIGTTLTLTSDGGESSVAL